MIKVRLYSCLYQIFALTQSLRSTLSEHDLALTRSISPVSTCQILVDYINTVFGDVRLVGTACFLGDSSSTPRSSSDKPAMISLKNGSIFSNSLASFFCCFFHRSIKCGRNNHGCYR